MPRYAPSPINFPFMQRTPSPRVPQPGGNITALAAALGGSLAQTQGQDPLIAALSRGIDLMKQRQLAGQKYAMAEESHQAKMAEHQARMAEIQASQREREQGMQRRTGLEQALMGQAYPSGTEADARTPGLIDQYFNAPSRPAMEALAQYSPESALSTLMGRLEPKDAPAGFTSGPDGVLVPIPGGPADPDYLGERAKATRPPVKTLDEIEKEAAARARGAESAKPPESQYGEPQFDAGVGKWYQNNPKTGKREYTSQPSGLDIQFGADGDITSIRTGVPQTPGGMQKPTAASLEKSIIETSGVLSQIQEINRTLEPMYQTYKSKGKAWLAGVKAKAGMDMDPADEEFLTDFAVQRAGAGKLFADALKSMSGAAVSAQEMKRQEVHLPNPGTGILDGDDPVSFAAKSMRMEAFTTAAIIRGNYMKEKGINLETASRKYPLSARNPKTKKMVWLHEFVTKVQEANPQAGLEEIMSLWNSKYK